MVFLPGILSQKPQEIVTPPGGLTVLTGDSGSFADTGGNNNYPDNQTKYWRIDATTRITLTFTAFNTESGYDFLTIYDGTNDTAPILLNNYSGTTIPNPVTSSGNNLYIKFISDESVNRLGWEASWSPYVAPSLTYKGISLRKINSNSQYAIGIFKINGLNASHLDVGFNNNGELDMAAVNAFTNNGIAYVDKIYYQGGAGYFAVTANPQMVYTASYPHLSNINNKPTVYFPGYSYLTLTGVQAGSNPFSLATVLSASPANTEKVFLSETDLTANNGGVYFRAVNSSPNNANMNFTQKTPSGGLPQLQVSLQNDILRKDIFVRSDLGNGYKRHALYNNLGVEITGVDIANADITSSFPFLLGNSRLPFNSSANVHFVGNLSEIIWDIGNAWDSNKITEIANFVNSYYNL